jgi:hypothetical protein
MLLTAPSELRPAFDKWYGYDADAFELVGSISPLRIETVDDKHGQTETNGAVCLSTPVWKLCPS